LASPFAPDNHPLMFCVSHFGPLPFVLLPPITNRNPNINLSLVFLCYLCGFRFILYFFFFPPYFSPEFSPLIGCMENCAPLSTLSLWHPQKVAPRLPQQRAKTPKPLGCNFRKSGNQSPRIDITALWLAIFQLIQAHLST